MYTLYYAPSTASLVVHWLLIEIGAPHRLQRVDIEAGEHKRPEYLAINPHGVVPTLLVDGQPVHESPALAMHLADAHPEAGLAPAPGGLDRARYYQWMLHFAYALQPAFRQWFYPDELLGAAQAEPLKTAARRRIEAAWDRIDAHLARGGPYLLGDVLSAADFHLTMLMRWSRNMPRTTDEWPHLHALAARMKARPSFRIVYEREGITDWT